MVHRSRVDYEVRPVKKFISQMTISVFSKPFSVTTVQNGVSYSVIGIIHNKAATTAQLLKNNRSFSQLPFLPEKIG